MEELESVLARRAEALGVGIKRGVAITDFHQTEDGVTVLSNNQSFQSKWLVGCDGSRSVVRKAGVRCAVNTYFSRMHQLGQVRPASGARFEN